MVDINGLTIRHYGVDLNWEKLKHINVLLKPQEQCNMNCTYCFDQKTWELFKKKPFMSLETFERQIKFLSEGQDFVDITFHGGEPLLVGKKWFREQFKIMEKYPNVKQSSVQTNLVLLDEEWIDLFNKQQIKISTSFDGLTNGMTRGYTDTILNNMKLYYEKTHCEKCKNREREIIQFIMIVNEYNYDKLIDNYYYFKSIPFIYNVQFNLMFESEKTQGLTYEMQVEYLKQHRELFKIILDDEDGTPDIRNFYEFVNFLLNDSGYLCNYSGNCQMRWIGIYPDGTVTNCDRYPNNDQKYIYGTIFDYDNIMDMMRNSEGFKRVMLGQIERKRYCLFEKKCKVYRFCKGGCNSRSVFSGDITKPQNDVECYIFHGEINNIIEVLNETNIMDIKNKKLQRILLRNGFRNKKIIIDSFKELIKKYKKEW